MKAPKAPRRPGRPLSEPRAGVLLNASLMLSRRALDILDRTARDGAMSRSRAARDIIYAWEKTRGNPQPRRRPPTRTGE